MSYDSDSNQSPYQRQSGGRGSSNFSGLKLRLLIAGAIVLFSVVTFFAQSQTNPITGKKQHISMTVKDEIVLGLRGAPSMGTTSRDLNAQRRIEYIGARLVNTLEQQLANEGKTNPYPFEFHLLDDQRQINAFAIPGGQIFITEALFRLLPNDGELAGVLGHEMGHVIERHGAEQMAKQGMIRGIAGAAGVAGGDVSSTQAAAWIGNVVSMKYGREAELESDEWGIKLMIMTGYSPAHLLTVMDVLENSTGGAGPPEFLSTHPRPANRREYIRKIIDSTFPNGVPDGLQ